MTTSGEAARNENTLSLAARGSEDKRTIARGLPFNLISHSSKGLNLCITGHAVFATCF